MVYPHGNEGILLSAVTEGGTGESFDDGHDGFAAKNTVVSSTIPDC